jgi:DNA polymerase I-like protein with 3'-5' exonuclease and polymerase domains
MYPNAAYLNAGRDALIAAAKILEIDCSQWKLRDFQDFTTVLIEPYFKTYARMFEFRKEIVQQCIDNKGLVTCAGGLTVYFDEWRTPAEHNTLMRALLAFYGQGGTAGMIDRAMLDLYYKPFQGSKSILEHYGVDLLLQTHDSITYQVPIQAVVETSVINDILITMEVTNIFNGREYVVPCEAAIGPRWGKKTVDVHKSMTPSQISMALLKSFESDGLFI